MRRRGYTLIELLVSLVAMAVVLVLLVAIAFGVRACISRSGDSDESSLPTDSAWRWASGLGLSVQGVECAQWDTDHDGYISCTVATTDGQLHAVECAAPWSVLNSGCRSPKLRLQRGW